MHTGTVKWFDVKKGFGFIINPDGKDVFVHFSSIEGDGFRTLKDGDQVQYEEVDSGKGLAARNVKRVKAPVGAGAPGVPGMPSTGLDAPGGREFLH
jgi:CspA family cold shock protein